MTADGSGRPAEAVGFYRRAVEAWPEAQTARWLSPSARAGRRADGGPRASGGDAGRVAAGRPSRPTRGGPTRSGPPASPRSRSTGCGRRSSHERPRRRRATGRGRSPGAAGLPGGSGSRPGRGPRHTGRRPGPRPRRRGLRGARQRSPPGPGADPGGGGTGRRGARPRHELQHGRREARGAPGGGRLLPGRPPRRRTPALIAFNEEVRLLEPLSPDLDRVRRALDGAEAGGRTAIVDAVYTALRSTEPSARRTAVVVFSDGLDNMSWLGAAEVIEAARRTEAIVYGVAVREEGDRTQPFLRDVTRATGGRFFQAAGADELRPRFLDVLGDIRARYVLSFAPGPGAAGWHALDVELKRGKGDVLARPGYWRGTAAPYFVGLGPAAATEPTPSGMGRAVTLAAGCGMLREKVKRSPLAPGLAPRGSPKPGGRSAARPHELPRDRRPLPLGGPLRGDGRDPLVDAPGDRSRGGRPPAPGPQAPRGPRGPGGHRLPDGRSGRPAARGGRLALAAGRSAPPRRIRTSAPRPDCSTGHTPRRTSSGSAARRSRRESTVGTSTWRWRRPPSGSGSRHGLLLRRRGAAPCPPGRRGAS